MLCVSLPLEAAGALCLSGYLYLNGSNAMDGWWMTVCSLPSPSLSPITETFTVPRRCPKKAAQASWVQIRRVRGDSAVPSFSGDNGGQWAAHREMLCRGELIALRPPLLHFGVCEGLSALRTEAAVSWCIWGDGAGKSPVNFNTSMHRGRRSLGEERRVQRKEMLRGTAGREQSVLCALFECTSTLIVCSTCKVLVTSVAAHSVLSFWQRWLNVPELHTSSQSWTLILMIVRSQWCLKFNVDVHFLLLQQREKEKESEAFYWKIWFFFFFLAQFQLTCHEPWID